MVEYAFANLFRSAANARLFLNRNFPAVKSHRLCLVSSGDMKNSESGRSTSLPTGPKSNIVQFGLMGVSKQRIARRRFTFFRQGAIRMATCHCLNRCFRSLKICGA
jgi:hypothetical protein